MLPVKAGNGTNVVRLSVAGAQVGVTLGTSPVCRCLQQHGAFVLDVTRRTFGSECLIHMMHGGVMAGEAGFVGDMRAERSGLGDVTKCALLREYGVRVGERSRGIHFLAALRAL